MSELKGKLWCDLKSIEEKAKFIQLGYATKTGIIAPALQVQLAHDYNAFVASKKRIAELEKECERLYEANQEAKEFIYSYIKAPRSKIYGSDPIYNAEKEFEAIKLEQQAKGVEKFAEWLLRKIKWDVSANAGEFAQKLRQQAEELKCK